MADQALLTTLRHVGFDEKEARVYLALLELGSATATAIADKAGLKRAVVYLVVERLKKMGYAVELQKGTVKKFAPVDPTRVLQGVRTAADDFKFMLPILRALQDKGREAPRIEFLEGADAIHAIWLQLETYPDIRFVTSTEHIYELMPDPMNAWLKRCTEGRMHAAVKHLITNTEVDRTWAEKVKAFPAQEVRYLEKGKNMEMDFAIVNDMLIITSFDPLYAIVIHSEKIARSATLLFDLAFANAETA